MPRSIFPCLLKSRSHALSEEKHTDDEVPTAFHKDFEMKSWNGDRSYRSPPRIVSRSVPRRRVEYPIGTSRSFEFQLYGERQYVAIACNHEASRRNAVVAVLRNTVSERPTPGFTRPLKFDVVG